MAQPKPTLITRVFSEQDELALLRSIISYKSNQGHDPIDNLPAFKNFANQSLSFTATRRQVADKMRRLKQKYINTALRRGSNPSFFRDHDRKLFKLSKKIWATSAAAAAGGGDDDEGAENEEVENEEVSSDLKSDDYDVGGNEKDRKESGDEKDGLEDFRVLYPLLCVSIESEAKKASALLGSSKEYLKMVSRGIDEDKARELEKEWKAFLLMEHQAYVMKTQLMRKQTEALNDVISSSSRKS